MKKKIIALVGGTALLMVTLLNISAIAENNSSLDLVSLTTLEIANADNSESGSGNDTYAYRETELIEYGYFTVYQFSAAGEFSGCYVAENKYEVHCVGQGVGWTYCEEGSIVYGSRVSDCY